MNCKIRLPFALALTLTGVSLTNLRAQETVKVDRGDIKMTITERGVVEAVNCSDVICRVKGTSTIKWAIDDGALVKKGQKVLELDDAAIRNAIRVAEIGVEQQRADVATQEANLKVVESAAKSDLEIAQAYVQLAGLELEKVKKGFTGPGLEKLKVRLEQTKVAIAVAELKVRQNDDEESKLILRMAKLEHDKAKLELEEATQETSPVQVKKAEIAVLEANRQLETVRTQTSARIQQAQTQVRSALARLQQKLAVLNDYKEQLTRTVLYAPRDGMAVVYSPSDPRLRPGIIAVGEPTREGQLLFRICEPSQIEISTYVHESQISHIRNGQGAEVEIHAFADQRHKGKVNRVVTTAARIIDPFHTPVNDHKVYAVQIQLNQSPPNLKPGMTAEVRIAGPEAKNVLRVPVAAVRHEGRKAYCLVSVGAKAERREITRGISDGKYVEIKSGLRENDEVILPK